MNGWMDLWIDEWMDGQMDGQMDRRMNGQMDRWYNSPSFPLSLECPRRAPT
jgi:hypothetical protein